MGTLFCSISAGSEITRLVSASEKVEASAGWVTGLLERGESRLAWCRMAVSDGGELLAAHVFDSWSPHGAPDAVPTFVQLLGHTDPGAATALLRHDLAAFGARSVAARVVLGFDDPAPLRALREAQPAVLLGAGFHAEVDRVRLRWPQATAAPRPAGALTFRPAAQLPAATVERVFAAVGDGSLDHGMRAGRAEAGRVAEAAGRLAAARRRRHPDDWFVIGHDRGGEPVGYVQAALSDGDAAFLAELGVVEAQRGRGYAGELLGHGTAAVLAAGYRELRSDTDQGNHPMRAAFARAGYREFAERRDLRWRADAAGQAPLP